MKQGIKDYQEIRSAFAKVGTKGHEGIEIGEWDQKAFEAAYRNFTFYLLPHKICGQVLYAAYDPETGEQPFWETFANLDGEMRHWLHFTTPVFATTEKECDNLCYQAEISEDKPDQTVGIRWYAYRIPGMTPYLMEQYSRNNQHSQGGMTDVGI